MSGVTASLWRAREVRYNSKWANQGTYLLEKLLPADELLPGFALRVAD